MVAVIICFIVSLFIFLNLGNAIILKIDNRNFDNYNLFDSFFIGLALTGAFLNLWSLFLPTNGTTLLVLFGLTILSLSLHSKLREKLKKYFILSKTKKTFLIISFLFLLIFSIYAVMKPSNYDTYLYHMSSIQWIEQYKVVPGLANMQERLGFNSSVFVLSAGFSFNSWFGQNLFIINSLSFLVFSVWLLWITFRQKGALGLFALLFLYFFLNQYTTHISSPGSDVLPNIFIGYLLISVVLNPDYLKSKYLLFVILPLFGITLKISIAPVILLSIYVLLQRDRNVWQLVKKGAFFGIALVFPWLIRNIVLSGYLIYPMDEIDLFSFEWKVPKEKVVFVKSWIYSWAKDPTKDYSVVLNRSFGEWFPIWWSKLFSINKLFFISATLAPTFGTIYIFWKRKEQKYPLILAFLIGYICVLFWLKAPDFRFSFGVILFLALLPILLLESVQRYFRLLLFYGQ